MSWPWRRAHGLAIGILIGISPSVIRAADDCVSRLVLAAGYVALFVGACFGATPAMRKLLRRPVQWSESIYNNLVMVLVLQPGIVIYLTMAQLLHGHALDMFSVLVMGCSAILILTLHLGWTLFVGRALGLVEAPSAHLRALVARTAARVGMPMPRTELIRWPVANAMAWPLANRILFTRNICELLNDNELESICAHELAHLNETSRQKFARILGSFSVFPLFTIGVLQSRFGIAGLIAPIFIWLVSRRLLSRFSQKMEQQADSEAAHHEAVDGVYACALEKIYESNLVPAVLNGKGQTHPHLYDRLVSAGIEPDYPRPPVPSRWAGLVGAALFLIPALVLQMIFAQLIGKWMDLDCDDEEMTQADQAPVKTSE